jgi:hypothetical protein
MNTHTRPYLTQMSNGVRITPRDIVVHAKRLLLSDALLCGSTCEAAFTHLLYEIMLFTHAFVSVSPSLIPRAPFPKTPQQNPSPAPLSVSPPQRAHFFAHAFVR